MLHRRRRQRIGGLCCLGPSAPRAACAPSACANPRGRDGAAEFARGAVAPARGLPAATSELARTERMLHRRGATSMNSCIGPSRRPGCAPSACAAPRARAARRHLRETRPRARWHGQERMRDRPRRDLDETHASALRCRCACRAPSACAGSRARAARQNLRGKLRVRTPAPGCALRRPIVGRRRR